MRDLLILILHFITTVIRLAKPGGLRAVVAESVHPERSFAEFHRCDVSFANSY